MILITLQKKHCLTVLSAGIHPPIPIYLLRPEGRSRTLHSRSVYGQIPVDETKVVSSLRTLYICCSDIILCYYLRGKFNLFPFAGLQLCTDQKHLKNNFIYFLLFLQHSYIFMIKRRNWPPIFPLICFHLFRITNNYSNSLFCFIHSNLSFILVYKYFYIFKKKILLF